MIVDDSENAFSFCFASFLDSCPEEGGCDVINVICHKI